MGLGFTCDDPSSWHFENMPVPATKVSWEACDELCWKSCVGKSLNPESTPSFGDLITDQDTQGGANSAWEETMDEMGLIVAMTARLPMDNIA
jgi:hypothetical protein